LGALSYAVNIGQGPYQTPPFADNDPTTHLGVFRDLTLAGAVPISMSNVTAPSRRPLISDIPYQGRITGTAWLAPSPPRLWTAFDGAGVSPPVSVTAAQLGFAWPGAGLVRDFGPVDFAHGGPLGTKTTPTNHSGITIVTFCDGHSEKLDDSALCNQFDYLPIQ
jgi:hypothetical protein